MSYTIVFYACLAPESKVKSPRPKNGLGDAATDFRRTLAGRIDRDRFVVNCHAYGGITIESL